MPEGRGNCWSCYKTSIPLPMNDVERRQLLRRLWMDNHPEDKRTAEQVLLFHAWLEKTWPELLARRTLDELKADLEFLYQ